MSDISIVIASNQNNLKLAKQVEASLTSQGITHRILDLVSMRWPLFTPGAEKSPEFESELLGVTEQLKVSKGIVWISPEYNGGLPPAWSNFLAWVSLDSDNFRACFNGKPAAIMSFSGTGTNVLQFMRLQLAYLGMNVIGRQLLANFSKPAKETSVDAISSEIGRLIS